MKALSIIQPWAQLIVLGYKDIENRDWPTRFRGRIAVHASKKYDVVEWEEAQGCISEARGAGCQVPKLDIGRFDVAYGAVIGTVEIVDCVTASRSPWFFGRHGFILRDPEIFATPIPWRGSLGLWDWQYPEARRG